LKLLLLLADGSHLVAKHVLGPAFLGRQIEQVALLAVDLDGGGS
jgi:hypothetical protein